MTPLVDERQLPAADLDRDYNARATVTPAEFDLEMARYRQATLQAKARCARHLDVVYDAESGQRLDIYGPPLAAGKKAAVFIFIHGGYWRALSKDDSAMMAEVLARQGIASVVIDYRLAPAVSLTEIVREVRAAVAFVWKHADDYGLDRDRITIGGSSAGGHLVGAVLAPGWHAEQGVPEDIVKFALPISGLFELAPLSRTFPQEWLQLDEDQIAALSPMRHLPRAACPMVVAWAAQEPAGFRRQSLAYAELWRKAGAKVRELEIPKRNHFNVLMELSDPDSTLTCALLSGIEQSGRWS